MKKLKKGLSSTKRSRNTSKVIWEEAGDVKNIVLGLLKSLSNDSVKKDRIFCFRSFNTSTRAIARIWGLPRIWQSALKQKPAYCIEVISERFDKLNDIKKKEVLIHELAHIPNNFSGSLVPHIRRGKRNFFKRVKFLIKSSKKNNLF